MMRTFMLECNKKVDTFCCIHMPKPPTARLELNAFLEAQGTGAVFTRRDVQGLAPAGSIGSALARLVKEGRLQRLGPGLFHYPRFNSELRRVVPPDLHAIAQALARKFGWTLIPSGQWAANQLGLSTQVPAHAEYFSDGPDRTESFGRRRLKIRHARPKDLLVHDPEVSAIIQALRYLGKDRVDKSVVRQLCNDIPKPVRDRLLELTRSTSHWLHDIARRLVNEEGLDGG